MPGSTSHREQPSNRPSRRGLLVAGAAAGGAAVGGGIVWTLRAGRHQADPMPSATSTVPGASDQCLTERELPAAFVDSFSDGPVLEPDEEDLGTPFATVSLQEVVRLPPDGGADRLAITQRGASAQIQFVRIDGSENPVVHDVDFGVNPGVAVSEDGTSWFVTREKGLVLSVSPDLETLTSLGRVSEDVTSLYNPVIGRGGTVFGGSYPSGAVWAATPSTGEIKLGPRIGDNEYVRSLAVVGDRIFAGTSGNEPMLVEVDPVTLGARATFDVPSARAGGSVFRLTTLPGDLLLVYRDEKGGGTGGVLFDPAEGTFSEELSPGASSRSLAITEDDEVVYVSGGDLMRWIPGESEPEVIGSSPVDHPSHVIALSDGRVVALVADPIGASAARLAPVLPVGAEIAVEVVPSAHDLTAVIAMPSTGQVAIGGYQGDGLVVVDTGGKIVARTPAGAGVQQVEGGIQSGEGTVLVGSYGEGRVHELRIEPGSNELGHVEVADLGEISAQARPVAWTELSTGYAVGTVPEQGRLGGLLQTFIRRDGGVLASDVAVADPADGQSIVGLVDLGDGDMIITTSVLGGYGADGEAEAARVMRIVLESGDVVWDTTVPVKDAYSPVVQHDRVFSATTAGILVLDLESGELLAHTMFGDPAESAGYTSARIEPWEAEGRFLHSSRGTLSLMDMVDRTRSLVAEGVGSQMAVQDGGVFVPSGARLSRFSIPPSGDAPDCP